MNQKKLFQPCLALATASVLLFFAPQVVEGVAGDVQLDLSAGGQIVGTAILAGKVTDSSNASYYLDPAADPSLIVAGKVGIGTTAPTQLLTVGSPGSAGSSFYNIGANTMGVGSSLYSYGYICAGNSSGACTGTGGVVLSNAGTITAAGAITATGDIYSSQWFRPTGATGMYWNAYGSAVFSDSGSYVKTASTNGIVLYAGDRTTLRGYVYTDGSNFGLLGSAGSWAAYIPNGTNYVIAPASLRTPIVYDQDNTGYYVDPASTTVLNSICAGGNCGSYLTHDGTYLKTVGNFRVSGTFYNDSSAWSSAFRTTAATTSLNIYSNIIDTVAGSQNYFLELQYSGANDTRGCGGAYCDLIWNTGVQGMLMLSGDLTGQSANTYPTLKTNGACIYFDAGATYTGYICNSGGFTDVSDERLKTNIVTVSSALDKLSQIRGVTFNWKDGRDSVRHMGVLAQDVEKVAPELVTQPGGIDTKGVFYGGLTALTIEAIKEQQAQIEDLKSQLSGQQQQIDELKSTVEGLKK